jgi:hypothetical protein
MRCRDEAFLLKEKLAKLVYEDFMFERKEKHLRK